VDGREPGALRALKAPTPTLAIVDSQSVKSADTLGLLINLAVTPADVQDRNTIAPLLTIAGKRFPSIEKAIANGGYQGKSTADDVQD
jgi:hypothetical protein